MDDALALMGLPFSLPVIILCVVEVIIILLLIFLRKRILIAIALIKEASRYGPPRPRAEVAAVTCCDGRGQRGVPFFTRTSTGSNCLPPSSAGLLATS